MISRLALFAAALALAVPAVSFDAAHLRDHLRKALNLDASVPVQVGDIEPSDFGPLLRVPVTIGANRMDVFVSEETGQYLLANVYDFAVDPDQERAQMLSMTGALSKGSAKAPVTVVEFSDLQCPHCARAHKIVTEQLHTAYTPDQVRLVYKHFPLANSAWSERGAVAVECARRQKADAGWGMLDRLFENAREIKPDTLRETVTGYAAELGLNARRFAVCMDAPDALARVQADKEEGAQVGVGSTPSFVVNGRVRRGFRRLEDLKVLIDEKLDEAAR